MQNNILLYNSEGWATFPAFSSGPKAKEPTLAGRNWASRVPDLLAAAGEMAAYLKAGAFGVVLNPEDLIVDLDKRSFKNNINPWKQIRADLGLGKIEAPAVITGNGVHIYFKKPPDLRTTAKVKGYFGLDIKSGAPDKGAYVIGAGSKHFLGTRYRFAKGADLSQIPDCPSQLLELFTRAPVEEGEETNTFTGGEQEYIRYLTQLAHTEIPAMQERAGDAQRFRIACIGRDYGLKPKDTLRAIQGAYNPYCVPVWTEEKLKVCVHHAYKYASGIAGKEDPIRVFNAAQMEEWDSEPDETRHCDLDNHQQPRKTLKNAILYLYITPELQNSMRYNQFTGDLELTGKLPWHKKRGPGDKWTDTDVVLLKYHLAKRIKVEFSTALLWEALHAAGMRFAYHPVQEYIKDLIWDGKPRLNFWLTKYCRADNNQYTAAVGRKLLLGLIARVFIPGVKFDYCVVLEGPQGIGKSTVCSILGKDWYGDVVVDPHSRDTIDALRGKWVVELSEMEVTKRSDAQALKAFISRTHDRARLAYARATLDFPRQCIFIGTINPDEMGYLVDTTGNRRFWPIKCGGKIDMKGLAEVRDQLFAEAYTIFQANEELYLSGELLEFAELEQHKRMAVDPWQDVISIYLADEGKDIEEISIPQVWEIVFGGQARNLTRPDQCRIGRILTSLRWWKSRPTRGGSRQYVHRRPDVI